MPPRLDNRVRGFQAGQLRQGFYFTARIRSMSF
jgi:hypothetical protein